MTTTEATHKNAKQRKAASVVEMLENVVLLQVFEILCCSHCTYILFQKHI
jgi:hypothetical protein